MPRIKLTKPVLDALQPSSKDEVYWDAGLPGFGVKVTPKGRKVFIVLYRTLNGTARLRKYTIGPYGPATLAGARAAAQKILAARLDGRDPALEKRQARRRSVSDSIEVIASEYIARHLASNRSGGEVKRLIDKEVLTPWVGRSIHEITKSDVLRLLDEIVDRGAPATANRTFSAIRGFFNWCIRRALIEKSPCFGLSAPSPQVARDRVLTDEELAAVIGAARQIGYPYGAMVELLALTGQRRGEVAGMLWSELDPGLRTWTISSSRTKNNKQHIVHLSEPARALLAASPRCGPLVFSGDEKRFNSFNHQKSRLDSLSGVTGWVLHDLRRTVVSGMAHLGIAPHVADKILNHQSGTISGVAAVYQRHEFMAERKEALERWANHAVSVCAPIPAIHAASGFLQDSTN